MNDDCVYVYYWLLAALCQGVFEPNTLDNILLVPSILVALRSCVSLILIVWL
jgi:hypothetical protein